MRESGRHLAALQSQGPSSPAGQAGSMAGDPGLQGRLWLGMLLALGQLLRPAAGQYVNVNAGSSRLCYTSLGLSTYLRSVHPAVQYCEACPELAELTRDSDSRAGTLPYPLSSSQVTTAPAGARPCKAQADSKRVHADNFTLRPQDYTSTALVNRSLAIRGKDWVHSWLLQWHNWGSGSWLAGTPVADSAPVTMLDLGQVPAVMTIQPNTNVSFENVMFQNSTPQGSFPSGTDGLDEAVGLAVWPSIVVQPQTTARPCCAMHC